MTDFKKEDPEAQVWAAKWKVEQEELKKQLVIADTFDWKLIPRKAESASSTTTTTSSSSSTAPALKYVGGVDISFQPENPNEAVASLVVLEYPELKVVYESYKQVIMKKPYIAGFLGFREVDFLVELVEDLRADKTNNQFFPQLILVDGNGILHQRGFGLACQLGVTINLPTIGVAKKLLFVDGIDREQVKKLTKEHLTAGGTHCLLQGQSGAVHGAIVQPTNDTSQPVYVSPGHMISMETSIQVVKQLCLYRVPEPVRQADLLSRKYIRDKLTPASSPSTPKQPTSKKAGKQSNKAQQQQ